MLGGKTRIAVRIATSAESGHVAMKFSCFSTTGEDASINHGFIGKGRHAIVQSRQRREGG